MTQLNSIRTFLFFTLFLFLSVNSIIGQQYKNNSADTVIVYDTIMVYDTLHVSEKIKAQPAFDFWPIEPRVSDRNFQLEPGKLQGLKKNDSTFAAFFKPSIIYNENRVDANKKQDFLIIHRFWNHKKVGVILGGGAWWVISPTENFSSRSIYSSNTGLFMEGGLSEHIMLRFELNYCHLYPDFFFNFFYDDIYSEIDGTVDSLYQFNQISLPVKLSYRFNNLQLYAGLECTVRLNSNEGSKKRQNMGLCLGGNYWFSKRFSVGVNYSMGFANQHDMVVYMKEDLFSNQYKEKYNGKGNSRMIDLSLYFILNRNNTNEP